MAKINFSIDDGLLKRLDDYCDSSYMTRSGFICMAINQALSAEDVRRSLVEMTNAFNMIAERGEISEENKKTLEEFKVLAKVFGDNIG